MPACVPSCSIAVDRWRNRLERRRDTEALPGAPGGADTRAFGARWTYVAGSTRRRLAPLLHEIAPIDVLLHDSHHTGANMRFELGEAWPRLKPGGVLLCDDAQENGAFAELVDGLPSERWAVGQQEHKPALFGIAVRPLESASGS
ncbi:MAG: class I SAM-dependent methyltransferase [Actinomycetota bacterium]|nr:class I SAM-dependent methyltransferase [Actinomycetota bacterium]